MRAMAGNLKGSSPHTRGARPPVVENQVARRIIPAYAGSTSVPRHTTRTAADHPRIRGEHVFLSSLGGLSPGSSPHTRGARVEVGVLRVAGGIIPAYAGSTPWFGRGSIMATWIIPAYAGSTPSPEGSIRRRTDHPRIRGEHLTTATAAEKTSGSSPHTRGARGELEDLGAAVRIIPAYAGSTARIGGRSWRSPDHPRIRGEHNLGEECSREGTGSSPHTRGAPGVDDVGLQGRGIIPAYAGSTSRRRPPGRPPADHPRIRGEHIEEKTSGPAARGSSPHTRGARQQPGPGGLPPGIIPAYAGSTSRRSCAGRSPWDHPRIRGEHRSASAEEWSTSGSSPHTRGARRSHRIRRHRGRIIPAYAGSTRYTVRPCTTVRDHPRIRGEHTTLVPGTMADEGSSPHTRGAPEKTRERSENARIIPAYAGST